MKIFKNLLLILATIFIFELSFTNEAKAAACSTSGGVLSEADIKVDVTILQTHTKLLFIRCICVQVLLHFQLSLQQ